MWMVPGFPLDFATVAATFASPVVRARLDWKAARALDLPVTLRFHRGDPPASWITTWYIDAASKPCHYDDPQAHPLTVADVVVRYRAGRPWDECLSVLATTMYYTAVFSQMVVLTWALPGAGTLIVDGNHRVCAAAVAQIPVVIVEVCLEGPCDPALLVDLTHHQLPVG